MVKSGTSKSVWAQFGLGGKSRDTDVPSEPVGVSEDAQARSINKKAANLEDFNRRDRLPERPNTSAGPASSFAKRKTAEKREIKDDLHFNPLALHGRETTFYNFPLPGSLPTPENSPKTASPSLHETSIDRPSTPESLEVASVPVAPAPEMNSRLNFPQEQIGMALGSPSHAPPLWQEYPVETYIGHESPDQMDVSIDGSWDNPPPKHKPSRWKILGGIFGGGKKASPAFYQLEPEHPQAPEPDNVQEPVSSDQRPKSRGRGWSNSTKRKNKPELGRSQTAPAFAVSGARAMAGTPEIRLEGGPLINNASKFAQKGAGLLNVDIPTIQMERYSIMFSGVLQGSDQTSSSSSSSLLARRQATLDRLKTVNEALALKEQEIEATRKLLPRRETSPLATMTSSGLSLFPSTPSQTKDVWPPSQHLVSGGLYRSNTSPAALSPSRPSFAPGPLNEAHAKLVAKDQGRATPEKKGGAQESQTNKTKNESRTPSTASPKPTPWSPNKSHLTLDENSEVEDDDVVIIDGAKASPSNPLHFPMKAKLVEPDWQIITPSYTHTKQSFSGSTTSGSAHSNSSSLSTASSNLPRKSSMPSPLVSSPKAQTQARTRGMSSSRPAQTRSRSATTTPTPTRPPYSHAETIDSPTLHPEPIRSTITTTISASSQSQPRPPIDLLTEDENQARLTTLANVSMARQISVSRQQRQLLIPIKRSTNNLQHGPNPNPSTNPGSKPSTPLPGVKTTSPLTAIAIASGEASSPKPLPTPSGVEKRPRAQERLVDVVMAVMPTVVVVSSDREREEELEAAGRRMRVGEKIMGLAERRRLLAKNGNGGSGVVGGGNANGNVNPMSREVRGERERELLMQNRKSERVVVESVR